VTFAERERQIYQI